MFTTAWLGLAWVAFVRTERSGAEELSGADQSRGAVWCALFSN